MGETAIEVYNRINAVNFGCVDRNTEVLISP
jgi:hypothetical protein